MRLFITTIILSLLSLNIFAQSVSQIEQYGFVWTFDTSYESGQFINGDYYVIDPGSGVTVVSVTPAPTPGRNGSMVNPSVEEATQGYDDRANSWNAGVRIDFPYTLRSGDSLISTQSKLSSDSETWAGSNIDSHVFVKAAAILTCLDTAPPENAFRPPYVEGDKAVYLLPENSFTDLSAIVLEAPVYPGGRTETEYLEYLIRGIERPWLNHTYNYNAREIHPYDNMYGYHREVGTFLSAVSTMVLTDVSETSLKYDLFVYFIQNGIDYYHMAITGEGDSSFFTWPVIFAGLMLNEEEIFNVFRDGRSYGVRRDKEKFYYADQMTSSIDSNIVPDGVTWTGSTVFFRKNTGNYEHEHLHPSEWHLVEGHQSNVVKNEIYRIGIDSHPHVGMVLSAMIMDDLGYNAKLYWDHPATFDYVLRWMTEPYEDYVDIIYEATGSSIDPDVRTSKNVFIDNLWEEYVGELDYVDQNPPPPIQPDPEEDEEPAENTVVEPPRNLQLIIP